MNIFLPYRSISKSVRSLDDRRLIKQILETKTIYQLAIGETNNNYKNHPVVKHYKQYPKFLLYYGAECCREYTYRFKKFHKYNDFFLFHKFVFTPRFIPVYAENSTIREFGMRKVNKMFQSKLKAKWQSDKNPKWTNRKSYKEVF